MAPSTPRIVALVALVLVLVSAAAYGISEAITKTAATMTTIPRHVDRVVVDAPAGNVHLVGGSGQRVLLHEDREWIWKRPALTTRIVGTTLMIRGSCPSTGPINRCRLDLTLTIPFDADVKVDADHGDIVADRLAGHIELDTAAGDVRGRQLNPVSVRTTTSAGDILLDFTTPPVSVTATSEDGDVGVAVPRGGEYRVDATTDAGDVRVEGVLRNDRALRSISVASGGGDVRVEGDG